MKSNKFICRCWWLCVSIYIYE